MGEAQANALSGSCFTFILGVRPKAWLVSREHVSGSSGNRGAAGTIRAKLSFFDLLGTQPRGLDLS